MKNIIITLTGASEKMVRTVCCITMFFLAVVMSGCGKESVTGKWVLDKERVNSEMFELIEAESGYPPTTETRELVRKQTASIECEYQFNADGKVHISYNMGATSFGKESGKWWLEDDSIRIETKKISGTGANKVGDRALQIVAGYLVWDDPRGMRWYLKKQ